MATSMCPDYGNSNGNNDNKITDYKDGTFFGPVKWKDCKINFQDGSWWNFWQSDTEQSIYCSSYTVQVIQPSSSDNSETITLSRTGSFTPPVSVTSVSLNKTSTNLTVGGSEQLTVTVAPNNATNKTVSWLSNNTTVATVSNNGLITAVSAGSATITVTTQDGNKTATCVVTIQASTYTLIFDAQGGSVSPASIKPLLTAHK
jgi:uncharacterized protein YjdB